MGGRWEKTNAGRKPGCGKTAFVKHLADKMGADLIVINMSTFEASDMNGIPYLDQETHEMKWSLPFWAKQAIESHDKGKKIIVFLDETNLAQSEVRNGAQNTSRGRFATNLLDWCDEHNRRFGKRGRF